MSYNINDSGAVGSRHIIDSGAASSVAIDTNTTMAVTNPFPVALKWSGAYSMQYITVDDQLAVPAGIGPWMAVSVAYNWGRGPDEVLDDVVKVAAAGAQLCLSFGNWPAWDAVAAENMTTTYFAAQGAVVAARLAPLVAAYPSPPGKVYILCNNECRFPGAWDGSDHSTEYWAELWGAFFAPVRAALGSWASCTEIIGWENSPRTPIQSGVLWDDVSLHSYNIGAKAGGYPHTDIQGDWSMTNGVPIGWNDDWQATIASTHDYTLSVGQGDTDHYEDSPAWRKAYYDDLMDRVVNPNVRVRRIIYYCAAGPNATLYWQATVTAVKAIYTDPTLRAAWLAGVE